MTQPPYLSSAPQWQPRPQPEPGTQHVAGVPVEQTAPRPGQDSHQWLPQPAGPEPLRLPASPSPYQQLWRTTWLRWWQPLLAIVLGIVLWLVATVVAVLAAYFIEIAVSGKSFVDLAEASAGGTGFVMTPGLFLANNVSLALLLPIVVLAQLIFFRLKPGWILSVTGKVRKGWVAACLAIVVPVWIVLTVVELLIHGIPDLAWSSQSLVLIVGILITTPLQAAGEEFMFRGLMFRGVGSYFASPKAAFWVGALVSTVAFAAAHFAKDLWLNLFYLAFGLVACWVTWKTGSLIAGIVIHVVNNLIAEWLFPFTDISNLFDRSAGVGDWTILIHMLALVVAGFLIVRAAKRRELETLTPAS